MGYPTKKSIVKYQLGILDPDEFGGKEVPKLRVRDVDGNPLE